MILWVLIDWEIFICNFILWTSSVGCEAEFTDFECHALNVSL